MTNQESIQNVKERLISTYDPQAIYLFGSYAWGKADTESPECFLNTCRW